MMRRRLLLEQQRSRIYYFPADETGFVGKYKIPVNPGDSVSIEWDISRYQSSPRSGYQTAFAVNNSNDYYAVPADADLTGSYPLCCNIAFNTNIFTTGHHSFICGESVAYILIGYWYQSVISRDYTLYGDYVRVTIN